MKTRTHGGIPPTGQALLGGIAGLIHGPIAGGFAIALLRSDQPPDPKDGLWFLAGMAGIGACLVAGLGVTRALSIVAGTLAGSVVGVQLGSATGTHGDILFGATVCAATGGILGAST